MGIVSRAPRRTIRWAAVWKTARWLVTEGRERLGRLSETERREFLELMKKSRGRPSNLAAQERRRIRDFVKRLALGSSSSRS